MKKTISVNLANRNFVIEEDAYNMLDEYIKSIRNHYRTLDPDGEIVEDFEARLSELFEEKLNQGYGVISVKITSEVIHRLGEVETLADEAAPGVEGSHYAEKNESSSGDEPKAKAEEFKKTHRKFFREPRGKWLGGVLSGLAAYVDTDPMLLRLIFVILFFTPAHAAMLILYIAAWIFVPKATTAADRLAMEGKEVTSENLWNKISADAGEPTEEMPRKGSAAGEIIDESGRSVAVKKASRNWVWWLVAFIALAGAIATLIWLIKAVDDGWLDHFWYLPSYMDEPITIFAALLLALFAIGLALLIVCLVVYVLLVLPIGIIIRSEKISPQIKVILVIALILVLTFWIW